VDHGVNPVIGNGYLPVEIPARRYHAIVSKLLKLPDGRAQLALDLTTERRLASDRQVVQGEIGVLDRVRFRQNHCPIPVAGIQGQPGALALDVLGALGHLDYPSRQPAQPVNIVRRKIERLRTCAHARAPMNLRKRCAMLPILDRLPGTGNPP